MRCPRRSADAGRRDDSDVPALSFGLALLREAQVELAGRGCELHGSTLEKQLRERNHPEDLLAPGQARFEVRDEELDVGDAGDGETVASCRGRIPRRSFSLSGFQGYALAANRRSITSTQAKPSVNVGMPSRRPSRTASRTTAANACWGANAS
jgi:hypothetical protein